MGALGELTMDQAEGHLEFVAEFLATAAGRTNLLRASVPFDSRASIERELAAIEAEIQTALAKVNNLRTIVVPGSWRLMAQADGVHLPEDRMQLRRVDDTTAINPDHLARVTPTRDGRFLAELHRRTREQEGGAERLEYTKGAYGLTPEEALAGIGAEVVEGSSITVEVG